MVAFPRLTDLNRSIAPVGAAIVGTATIALFALMPTESLENMAWNSGIAAVLPVAEPPLGLTARAILAIGGGMLAAAVSWSALYLLFGPEGFLSPRVRKPGDMPAVRRADAHPDAPPRKPMTAADLGTPMMEVAAAPPEAPLPRDLDMPLAAFDPAAIPDEPREPVRPVAALAPVRAAAEPFAPGERIETFELTPVVRRIVPAPQPTPAPTIEALLRRLEAGANRRVAQG